MSTMMALRAHTRGGPEVLVYGEAPIPEPGSDEVLVAVHCAAITFAELGWDASWTRDGVDRTPVIPSHEVSGVVHAVGADVTDLYVGDSVYGLCPFDRDGAAAEYVAVPALSLAPKPRSLSHVESAALPLAALTAWQALVDHAQVKRGERLLIQGGAGGVGAFAVQLAAHLGGDVTATCLGTDVDFVRGLGAQRVVDFEVESLADEPDTFDVVLDTVGGATQTASFPLLRRGGRLVSLQGPPSAELSEKYGVEPLFFVVAADRDELVKIATLVDNGRLQVAITATYPVRDGRQAYESGANLKRGPGKTVLVVR
jgi:NADPH:quinone reductase-like Zn-dependent oxidoreductase